MQQCTAGDDASVSAEEDQVSDWGNDAAVYSSDSDLSEWEQPKASDDDSLHSEDLHQPDHTASGAHYGLLYGGMVQA